MVSSKAGKYSRRILKLRAFQIYHHTVSLFSLPIPPNLAITINAIIFNPPTCLAVALKIRARSFSNDSRVAHLSTISLTCQRAMLRTKPY